MRYHAATDDDDFGGGAGLDLLVGTARLWRSLGHHDAAGGFRIDGVTGPDEYSAVADNNVYTNLMAKRNLLAAAEAAEAHPRGAHRLEVDAEEMAAWRDAAAAMVVPWDSRLRVHAQADNFTNHAVWDFAATPPDKYPLLLHAPYFDLYRKQVVKQADLVLALFACGDEFTPEEKVRDFEYYEALTVRDSSLSACAQAIVAAETGHLDLAYDYLGEAAFVDLHDLNDNTRDGLHMASLAGCWLALVCGFGGFRDHGGRMAFAPRLPEPIGRLRFRLSFRGRCLVVDVRAREATYALDAGDAIEVAHHGDAVEVRRGRRGHAADPAAAAAPRAPAPAARARTAPARAGPARAGARGRVAAAGAGRARASARRAQSGAGCRPPPANAARISSGHGTARPVPRSMRHVLTVPSAAVPCSPAIARRYSTDVRPSAATVSSTSTGSLKRSERAKLAWTATRGVAPNVKSAIPSAVCSAASAASARRNTVVQW